MGTGIWGLSVHASTKVHENRRCSSCFPLKDNSSSSNQRYHARCFSGPSIGKFQEKSPSPKYAYLSCLIDCRQNKSTEEAASPFSSAFYLEENKSGSDQNFGLARAKTKYTEIMFGNRPSSNGSASSSTSTSSSSSSSSSGSNPMTFHEKQHYVCILCNK